MECKVGKFQQSPVSTSLENGDQQLTCKSPTMMDNGPSKGLTDNSSNSKNDDVLNICQDGDQLSINNSKIIADFIKTSLCASNHDHSKLLPAQDKITVLVISVTTKNPLHVVLGDTPYVIASITLGK